jgi:hypothetical protein
MGDSTAGRQTLLGNILSMGGITPERELEMRDSLFQELWGMYRLLQEPSHLYGAIDQLETILRRLPNQSPDLPGYLETLSSLRVSHFEITNSTAALDEAVELSLRAKDEAIRMGLPDKNKDVYLRILNGLGCSQSARFHHLHRQQDLDDAITTGRELISVAPKDSEFYLAGLSNLTSRLWNRHKTSNNSDDRNDAMRLLDQLILESPPGSSQRSAAHMHRYTISYSKFGDTGSLEDLDDAICHGESAMELMVRNHTTENFWQLLGELGRVYGDRYDKKGDLDDLRKALTYAEQRVRWKAPTHPSTAPSLGKYLLRAREIANKTSQISEVETLIQTAGELMASMPKGDYTGRGVNERLYGDLLTRRYTLTSQLEDLLAVVENDEKMCLKESEKALWLGVYLRKITRAPEDSRIRKLAREKLPGYFRTACETNGVQNASITLWDQHALMVMVYAEAIDAGEDPEEVELDGRVRDGAAKAKVAEEATKGKERWTWPEYTTELGLRSLVGDPITKKVIVEMPGLVMRIFGYPDMAPLSHDQFVKQEIRLEREAREKEMQEGLKPNPSLCRVCRRLKVLEPCSGGGWKWNFAKIRFIPYGNYGQVFMRQHCAVCGLLLALISCNKGLHPRLATIDPEIQGFGLEEAPMDELEKFLQEVEGEHTIQVSYGLKEVGALTIQGSTSRELRPELVPLQQLKEALRECDSDHGRECNGQALVNRLSSPIDMLQIDVVDECLVQTTSTVKYFALSYVWGTVPIPKTLKSNLAPRLAKGGLRSDPSTPLPQTIADAIAFVKSLGERFLWVDALCIIQDDELTKQQNIQQMDIVYSRAFATIIALSGLSAASGLPGIHPGTRTPLSSSTFSISSRSPTLELHPSSNPQAEVEQITITASPSPLSLTMASSSWNTRAWTFQERLLSARCIFIAASAVYFHCSKKTTICETGKTESRAAPALKILNNPLRELRQMESHGFVGNHDAVLRVVFGAYKGSVEDYTPRVLTFQGDVLNAFAGVFAMIGMHQPGKGVVCGLPVGLLDLGLLWVPVRKLKRREEVVVGGDALALGGGTGGNQRCPGWSWAGFVGPVEYRLFLEQEKRRPLPAPLVVGGFRVVHGGRMLTVAGREWVDGREEHHQSATMIEDVTGVDARSKPKDYGPNVLQFKAPMMPAAAFTRGDDLEYLCHQGEYHSVGEQAVYRLYDKGGKHCGICFEPMIPTEDIADDALQSFVGIVQHGESGIPFGGPNRVEGDIPLFNRDVYRASGPGSGVVDALLVVLGKDGICRRISAARIHAKAWEGSEPQLRHVVLG